VARARWRALFQTLSRRATRELQMVRTFFLCALGAALPALIAPATAQTLSASKDSTAVLPPVMVSAARFPIPLAEAPVGTTVLDADQIAASAAGTLVDLLAQQVGIQIRDNSGSPDRSIDLRGFGASGDQNTLILLDGRRINENELTSTALSAIPLATIERIEIMRGSGAVLFGGGATGGTIHIITRAPRPVGGDGGGQSGAGLAVGSLDTRELRAFTSTRGDLFALRADASALETANWRSNNALQQRNAAGELRTWLDRGYVALRFGADSQRLGLPGARSAEQMKNDPRGTATPLDSASRDDHRLSLAGAWRVTGLEFEIELGQRDGTVKSDYRNFDYYSERDRRVVSLTPRAKASWSADGIAQETVVGVDLENWRYATRGASSAQTLDTPWVSLAASQSARALYWQYRARWSEGTTLTVGARRQRVADTIDDALLPSLSVSGARWVGAQNLAISQSLTQGLEVYARIGRSFRFATVDELSYFFPTDPQQLPAAHLLAPQTSLDRELGVQWRGGGLARPFLRFSLFRNDLDNEIHFYAPSGSNVNLPPTRRAGLELEGGAQLSTRLRFDAGLSRTEAIFRSGTLGDFELSGREIPLVPRTAGRLSLDWRVRDATRFALAARHVGTQRFDNDQTNTAARMPAYSLVDLKVVQLGGSWNTALMLSNLFDRRYSSYGIVTPEPGGASFYPQRGRTLLLTVDRRF